MFYVPHKPSTLVEIYDHGWLNNRVRTIVCVTDKRKYYPQIVKILFLKFIVKKFIGKHQC